MLKSNSSTIDTEEESSKKQRKPTSVRDSNAGHDFHVLWATRKVITMLSPNSPLKCVKMEGVHQYDTAQLLPDEDHFLAADLTEYYGGEHFAEASQIIITQLKYSTRHENKEWTLGRLKERSSSTRDDSVIQRLAASYTDLLANGFSRGDVIKKTKIRLVSNQPLDPKLNNWIKEIQSVIAAQTKPFDTLQGLIDKLPKKPKSITKNDKLPKKPDSKIENVKKLHSFLGLSDTDFINFLQVLDFSGCGQDSRMGQQLAMIHDISSSVYSGGRKDALLQLTNLVRQEALPERKDSPGLTQEDILAELGVLSLKELFPEPSQLLFPKNLIVTEEAKELADEIINNNRVLAHGIAGVGKSTTVQQLQRHFPSGSRVVLYDCYGGGNYHSINSGRHTLQRFLFQISNELSIQTGLPFLIKAHSNEFDQIAAFQDRLNKASEIVDAAGGLLVLVIDAADNSVMKAEKEGSKRSFVPHLWELNLPDNCRLIMTARTGARADSLQAPTSTKLFELKGFNINASVEHFRQVFSSASQKAALAFHVRTKHNPRIQQYLLDKAQELGAGFAAFNYVFHHAHLTPKAIFEDLIHEAVQFQRDPFQANRQLATLICLQRPIPVEVFAGACGILERNATNFCQALRPGLVFEDAIINFRDEDFETHLRIRSDTQSIIKETHSRLADHFRVLASTDSYAARVVADHYLEAERDEALIELVLNDPSLEIITDSLLRIQTYRRRLQLAMGAAARLKRDADGVKLLLLAAETTRTNEATKNLVLANLSLANYFGNGANLSDYFERLGNEYGYELSWLGSKHYQLAAAYSHDGTQQALAEEHLKNAKAWVRRYMKRPKDERYNWRITNQDLANETEAIFWLHGIQKAKESLNRWKPLQARLDSLAIAVKQIALRLNDEKIEECLTEANLPLLGECVAVAALWDNKHVIHKGRVKGLANKLYIAIKDKRIRRQNNSKHPIFQNHDFEWTLILAELFANYQVDNTIILNIIDQLVNPFPDWAPLERGDFKEFLYPLRAATLKATLQIIDLKVDDLLPEKFRQKAESKKGTYSSDQYESERRRFRETVGFVLPIYTIRAQTLAGLIDTAIANEQIDKGIANLYNLHESNRHYYIDRQRNWLFGAGSALSKLSGQRDLLEKLFDEAPRRTSRYQARKLWIQLAYEIAPVSEYRQLAMSWLEKTANDAQDDSISVDDRWEVLLECSLIAFRYDQELSCEFYNRAVQAADQGVGEEVVYRLGISAHLLRHIASDISLSEGHKLGAKQAALIEAYKPFISGDNDVPTESTIESVTLLNLSAGLKLSSRWDFRNICSLDDSIVSILMGASAANQWSANVSIPFLRLLGEGSDYSTHALKLLDVSFRKAKHNGSKEFDEIFGKLCSWVLKDAPIGFRAEAIDKLITWTGINNMSRVSEVKQLEQAHSFVKAIYPSVKHSESNDEYKIKKEKVFTDWYSKATKGDLKAFQECDDLYFQLGDKNLAICLEELGKRIYFSQQVEFLNLICNLKLYQDSQKDLAVDVLATFLASWKQNTKVKEWAKEGLPYFFSKNIGRLTNEKDWPSHLESVCRLPLVGGSRAALLLPGVADKLQYLSADMFCRIAQAIINNLEITSARELVIWLLDRLETQLIIDGKLLPFSELIEEPNNDSAQPVKNIAEFAWYIFGYPDKRVRWQAVHAIREILTTASNSSFRDELLTALVKLSHSTTSSLVPDENDFFWMSARVWALLLFEQLALETPNQLALHAEAIAQHALNSELPHVQIRGLACSTIIRLQKVYPNILSSEKLQKLELVNQPTKYLIERRTYEAIGDDLMLDKADATYIEFDHMDIIPYWFQPLGRVFCQSRNTIAVLVERWICNQWGKNKEELKKRWDYQNRYDYSLKRFYKNSAPTIDSLETNLIQNALMCTAGELVDQFSVLMENYFDTNNVSYWDEWIEDRLSNTSEKGWLADVRTSIPLRAEFWGKMPQPWEKRIADDFLSALGIHEPYCEDWVVVYGNYQFGNDVYSGNVHVESLLVDSEMAFSLMRAMQFSASARYNFPAFGFKEHNEDIDWYNDLPNFSVEPIIQQLNSTYEGLEDTDTSHRKIGSLHIVLSDKFVTDLSLVAIQGYTEYKDFNNTTVAKLEVWNDDLREGRRHESKPYSSGQRVWIKRSRVLTYLQQTNRVLLMQVRLQRNYHSSHTKKEKRYDPGRHSVFILHQDGSLETVDQHCSPWATNRA